MESTSVFTPSVLEQWRRRENLLPGLVLLVLTLAGWAFIAYQASTMSAIEAINGARVSTMGGLVPFVAGWTAMMVAMIVPATHPDNLLYLVQDRQRLIPEQARVGTAA